MGTHDNTSSFIQLFQFISKENKPKQLSHHDIQVTGKWLIIGAMMHSQHNNLKWLMDPMSYQMTRSQAFGSGNIFNLWYIKLERPKEKSDFIFSSFVWAKSFLSYFQYDISVSFQNILCIFGSVIVIKIITIIAGHPSVYYVFVHSTVHSLYLRFKITFDVTEQHDRMFNYSTPVDQI